MKCTVWRSENFFASGMAFSSSAVAPFPAFDKFVASEAMFQVSRFTFASAAVSPRPVSSYIRASSLDAPCDANSSNVLPASWPSSFEPPCDAM